MMMKFKIIDLKASLLLLVFFTLAVSPIFSKELPPQAQKAKDLTNSLLSLKKSYLRSQQQSKRELKDEIITKAKQRQQLLLELAKSHPEHVLEMALTEEKRKEMPAEIQSFLERKRELQGKLESTYLDHFKKPELSQVKRELITDKGERLQVHISNNPPSIPFGGKVKTTALQLSSDTIITGGETDTEYPIAYAGADGSVNTSLYRGANDTFGEVKVLIMLVNFQDKQEQPYTHEYAHDLVFNQVNSYFKENSYGQSWLTGDITPWMTLPMSTTDSLLCAGLKLADYADAAAKERGFDVSAYDRLVYVFPKAGCWYGGSAQIGGTRTWINGSLSFHITAHELGHNYGLHHSHSLPCKDGTSIKTGNPLLGWSEPWMNCSSREYGNYLDVMGSSDELHFNPSAKEQLGWLEYGNSPDITEITQNGRYEIDVMASQDQSDRPKALKILKSIDEETGYKTWYYLEFRRPVGFDSSLSESFSYLKTNNINNGVIVHAVYASGANSQWLLDMTTETPLDLFDPALTVGNTFKSPDSDLYITTVAADSTKATVDIRFDGPPEGECITSAPSIGLQTSTVRVDAATHVSKVLTVKNNDSYNCVSRTFNLSNIAPAGWEVFTDANQFELAPGEVYGTTLHMISPSNAVTGQYTINVTVNSDSGSVNKSLIYEINGQDWGIVTATDDNATTEANVPVVIDVLANDSHSLGYKVDILSYIQPENGKIYSQSKKLYYVPNSDFVGTDSFYYTASGYPFLGAIGTVTIDVSPNSADSEAPSIEIVYPTNSQYYTETIEGQYSLLARAYDNVWVERVDFYLDGQFIGSDFEESFRFLLDTTKYPNGLHKIGAQSFDISGNKSEFIEANVEIKNASFTDITPPTVKLTSPSAGEQVSGAINIQAMAEDVYGVAKVDFYLNGSLIGSDTTEPFQMSYDTTNLSNGTHSLASIAIDTSGNKSTAASISITVENSAPNNPPLAASDNVSTKFETAVSINVLANDSDPDGDLLSVSNYTQAVHGTLLLSDGVFTYTPDTGFSGNDSFAYTISDGRGGSSSANVTVKVAADETNSAPVAAFTFSCSDLTCSFQDGSSDSDGYIASRSFNFGDGNTSSLASPSHSYASEGSYSVTLTITDNDGTRNSVSKTVKVTAPIVTTTIKLSSSMSKNRGTNIVTLKWSGASGDQVRILRDGSLLLTTPNDGLYQDSFKGKASHSYQVCEVGADNCSEVTTN